MTGYFQRNLNPEILNNAAYAHQQLGNLEEARGLAQRALQNAPDNPMIMDTLGWIQHEMGDFDSAFKHLFAATQLAPEANNIRFHLVETLIALDLKDKAREELDNMRNLSRQERSKRDELKKQI